MRPCSFLNSVPFVTSQQQIMATFRVIIFEKLQDIASFKKDPFSRAIAGLDLVKKYSFLFTLQYDMPILYGNIKKDHLFIRTG